MFPARIPIVSVPPSGFENTYSLAFDGSDDYIDCGNDASLQITGNMTVSAWVKKTAIDNQRFITRYDGTNKCFYLSILANGKFRFNVTSSNTEVEIDGASSLHDSQWHHVTAVYTPSTSIKVYVNGILEGTNTSSIGASLDNDSVNFTIGAEGDAELPFTGNIDEVSIFNAIVSVGDLRNGSSGQGNAVPADLTGMSNLQGWWRFEEGSGTSATDSSDNSNTGTLTNGPAYSADVPS